VSELAVGSPEAACEPAAAPCTGTTPLAAPVRALAAAAVLAALADAVLAVAAEPAEPPELSEPVALWEPSELAEVVELAELAGVAEFAELSELAVPAGLDALPELAGPVAVAEATELEAAPPPVWTGLTSPRAIVLGAESVAGVAPGALEPCGAGTPLPVAPASAAGTPRGDAGTCAASCGGITRATQSEGSSAVSRGCIDAEAVLGPLPPEGSELPRVLPALVASALATSAPVPFALVPSAPVSVALGPSVLLAESGFEIGPLADPAVRASRCEKSIPPAGASCAPCEGWPESPWAALAAESSAPAAPARAGFRRLAESLGAECGFEPLLD
jgi:DNA segregation ATPase FtsK/SpoIIIE, S-DNA-T family